MEWILHIIESQIGYIVQGLVGKILDNKWEAENKIKKWSESPINIISLYILVHINT